MTTSDAVRAGIPLSPLRTIRPMNVGIRSAALARTVALGAPVCVTIMIIAAPHHMAPLLATMLVAALISAVITRAAARSRIEFSTNGVIEYGLSGSRFTPLDRIAAVMVVPLYDVGGVTVQPQLFVLDHAGRTLLRMRGRYWTESQMSQVAVHLDVPTQWSAEAVTMAELRHTRRAQLYWFERHPLLKTSTTLIGGASGIVAIMALTQYALH